VFENLPLPVAIPLEIWSVCRQTATPLTFFSPQSHSAQMTLCIVCNYPTHLFLMIPSTINVIYCCNWITEIMNDPFQQNLVLIWGLRKMLRQYTEYSTTDTMQTCCGAKNHTYSLAETRNKQAAELMANAKQEPVMVSGLRGVAVSTVQRQCASSQRTYAHANAWSDSQGDKEL